MYKFFMIFLLFALSACEGGGGDVGGVRGSTRPDAVLPNVVLNVAADNSVIQLEVGDGGSFDRLDMFYCGSGSVDADADCKPLSSGTLRSFTFTQVHALDYEGSSGGNSLKKDAEGGVADDAADDAEDDNILTSMLSGATTYTFKFDAFKADGNTNVGDTDSSMMSATTYDTDNLLRVNVPYARISHDVSSFDTSFDVMDAVRDVQMSYHSTTVYRHTFDNFIVHSSQSVFKTTSRHCAGKDTNLSLIAPRADYFCTTTSKPASCDGGYYTIRTTSCILYADVQVSIPGRWMWNSESAVTHTAPNNHDDVACTYTRPENYIMGFEPLLTNTAISAGVAGGNDRSFYGFDASDVDTTFLFTDEDSDTSSDNTLNEDLAFTINDDGERVFEFNSMYTVDGNTERVSFTPSGNLFRRSYTPVRISCYRPGFGLERGIQIYVNIDPASIYQPLPVSANKTMRTITYRVPRAASFTKPASASFGVLPHTRSGFPPITSVNNADYILYNFYDGFSDSYFNNRVALTIPELLLNAPLSVTSQHEEEARYQLKVINQYTAE